MSAIPHNIYLAIRQLERAKHSAKLAKQHILEAQLGQLVAILKLLEQGAKQTAHSIPPTQ